jgi:hypothetical protein
VSDILMGYDFHELIHTVTSQASFHQLVDRIKESNNIVFIGNGGNMAVANHLASDISRYLNKFTIVPDAIHLTAVGGDNHWVKPYLAHTIKCNKNIDLIVGITSRTTSPIYKAVRSLAIPSSILLMTDSNHDSDIVVPVSQLHVFETVCLLSLYSVIQHIDENFHASIPNLSSD